MVIHPYPLRHVHGLGHDSRWTGHGDPATPGTIGPLPANAPVPETADDLVADDPELAPLPESPAASEEAAVITGSTCSDSGGKNGNIVAGTEDYDYGTSFSYTVRASEGTSCNVQIVSANKSFIFRKRK